MASHKAPRTTASSAKDAVQFVTGSGDVFIAARPPAFMKCVPAVIVPPSSAAANAQAGPSVALMTPAASSAPAGMRMKVCTTSQTVSTAGILSAKNSIKSMKPVLPSTSGCESNSKLFGALQSNQWKCPVRPIRNNTAYRRMPLAHARASAKATLVSWSNWKYPEACLFVHQS